MCEIGSLNRDLSQSADLFSKTAAHKELCAKQKSHTALFPDLDHKEKFSAYTPFLWHF